MPKAEAHVTPARALGTTLRTYQVDLKQPPPCRFVPWAMHKEGQRTLLTWRIDASYIEPKVRSTCDIFRAPGGHPAHVLGRVEAGATALFVPVKGQKLPNTGQLSRL